MNRADLNKLKSRIVEHKSGANGLCVVEGFHALKHAIRFGAQFEFILAKNKLELSELAEKLAPDLLDCLNDPEIIEVGDEFDSITKERIKTGVVALAHKHDSADLIPGISVLLDDPKDLSNVGAVIRTAAGLGVKNLILTGATNAWNFRAIRAAAGLQFALNIVEYESSIKAAPVLTTKKMTVVCFDERGDELDAKLIKAIGSPVDMVLIYGSERSGISSELINVADKVVRLPMKPKVSSYNLAASVAIGTYAIVNNIRE